MEPIGKDLTGNKKIDHDGDKSKKKKESHKTNDLLIKRKMPSIDRAEIERNAFSNTRSLYIHRDFTIIAQDTMIGSSAEKAGGAVYFPM